MNDVPLSFCADCLAQFYLCWDADPLIDGIKFCPFCGSEDSVATQGDEDDLHP